MRLKLLANEKRREHRQNFMRWERAWSTNSRSLGHSNVNVVAKIADDAEDDESTGGWKVSYAGAVGASLKATIKGVEVPYLDFQTLIKSKTTRRKQDKVDVQRLLSLNQPE